MSERTDALIWQGRMRDLRDEIAAIEAERDGLRVEFNQLRELSRMEKEALIGASKAVERILRARVTELEAAKMDEAPVLRSALLEIARRSDVALMPGLQDILDAVLGEAA